MQRGEFFAAWSCAWLLVMLAGCSPIEPVRSPAQAGSQAARDAGGLPPGTAQPMATTSSVRANASCSTEGARNCEGKVPLSCEAGVWVSKPSCGDSERCEPDQGSDQGQCVPIPPACLTHADGERFCDGDRYRTCHRFALSAPETCGSQRRCADTPTGAECVCAGGTVDEGRGCEMPSSCKVDNGGCDGHTMCSIVSGSRVCSGCPGGYVGDGIQGCAPELSALTISPGLLTPEFSRSVRDYRVQLSLAQAKLTLTASGPADARLAIGGAEVMLGTPWSTSIARGAEPLGLQLSTSAGARTRYTLNVERSLARSAFIKAELAGAEDKFGDSVALWGDVIVVGARLEDSAGGGVNADPKNNAATDSGAAYVFRRRDGKWAQEAYLKPDAPMARSYFGTTTAVWGDTVAVAQPNNDLTGSDPRGGIVYLFERMGSTWVQHDKLTSGKGADHFGVGISLERDRLAIGAPTEDGTSAQSGAVYVYERAGGAWGKPVRLAASDAHAGGAFGWSVKLSGDTLVVGADDRTGSGSVPTAGAGAAYVFAFRNGQWNEQQILRAPQAKSGSAFGWTAAIDGDVLAVAAPNLNFEPNAGSGEVHLYTRSAETWRFAQTVTAEHPRPSDYFGNALALASGVLWVGAPGDSSGASGIDADSGRDDAADSGALYLFERGGTRWEQSAYIKASKAQPGARFTDGIGLYGSTVVVSSGSESSAGMGVGAVETGSGADRSGAVYVFD